MAWPASLQPRPYRVPRQPLLDWHQVGGASRSPTGLSARQGWEPDRSIPGRSGGGVERATPTHTSNSNPPPGAQDPRAVGSTGRETTPAATNTTPVRQLLLRQRENDTGSGRQTAAFQHSMRREERVTVHGPVKKQQPDGMSHRGGGGGKERESSSGHAHWGRGKERNRGKQENRAGGGARGAKRETTGRPGTPTTGLRERGNDTSKSTGRSGRQNEATRRNMRREEWVTVLGPVKKQQPDEMSHGGQRDRERSSGHAHWGRGLALLRPAVTSAAAVVRNLCGLRAHCQCLSPSFAYLSPDGRWEERGTTACQGVVAG